LEVALLKYERERKRERLVFKTTLMRRDHHTSDDDARRFCRDIVGSLEAASKAGTRQHRRSVYYNAIQ